MPNTYLWSPASPREPVKESYILTDASGRHIGQVDSYGPGRAWAQAQGVKLGSFGSIEAAKALAEAFAKGYEDSAQARHATQREQNLKATLESWSAPEEAE